MLMLCCYEVGLSPSDMYGGLRSLTFRELHTLFPSSVTTAKPERRASQPAIGTRRVQCWMWAVWLLRELRVLEWTKYFFILSCGIVIENAAKLALSVSLPPSPPVSPSFHQDEDYWVRKILSGLTKHYDFKLRSKPRIFLVSLLS